MKPLQIYIAGSFLPEYSADSVKDRARIGSEIMKAGHLVCIPVLDLLPVKVIKESLSRQSNSVSKFALKRMTLKNRLNLILEWLSAADCILIVPDHVDSIIFQSEISEAEKLSIPIFYLDDLDNLDYLTTTVATQTTVDRP